MKKWLFGLLILFISIPTYLIFGQDNVDLGLEITGANPNEFPVVTITTNVLDNTGLPVENLTIEDFVLGGDFQDRATITRVENITADDLPFATVLVIDVSTSMSGSPLAESKQAASLFVQSVGDDDPVAIVTFSTGARLAQDYTTDKDQLLSVIDGLQPGGQTALYDAAVLGVDVANQAPVSRRAMILLSDGAEFGGWSANSREAGLDTAIRDGVSVYTIGLGFGTDRSYLENLANGTNARSFESPTPQELTTIYGDLAELFRTQYVITVESDLPLDGTTYDFTLQADTEQGVSNVDSGTVRAPVPVPIVTLDEGLFAVPFSTPVTITPSIVADDDLSEINVTIGGEEITVNDDGSFVIDPVNYPPASYDLTVTVTDVDGDTGSDSVTFQTAAIASDIELDFAADTEISEPTTLTISADGQTPATRATYSILQDGTSIASTESTDADGNFPFMIDPFLLESGAYELFLGVENAGGATANVTVPFSVASVPPRNISLEGIDPATPIAEDTVLTVLADTQAGTEITSSSISLDGETLADNTIRPAELQPGTYELLVTVEDSNGESVTETIEITIAALAPEISLGDLPDPVTEDTSLTVDVSSQTDVAVTYSFDGGEEITLDGNEIPVTLADLEDGETTLTVTATNSSDLATSAELSFMVVLPATPTPTPDTAATQQAEAAIATSEAIATVDAQVTLDAQATTDVQTTADALATTEAEATVEAESNVNAEATVDAQSTADAELTAEVQATADVQNTADAELTTEAQATVDVQNTADAELTTEAQATVDAQSTADAEATEEQAAQEMTEAAGAQLTSEAQATADAQSTADAQGTNDASTEVAANSAATQTAEFVPTETLVPTATEPLPTLTPVEIINVDSQSAEAPPAEGSRVGLLIGAGGLIFAIILLGILWFGRSREERDSGR